MFIKTAAVLTATACAVACVFQVGDAPTGLGSDDGRIGKIVDAQGIVNLRPMMSDRWTPVCRQLLVKPGDWLRTDVRGANAAALTTTSHRKLTVGPGSLLELDGPNRMKLHSGEIKIAGSEQAEGVFELSGPGGDPVSIAADQTTHYRVDREGNLQPVPKPPLWLRGFEGTTADDSIGSLIVNVDGRNVPLTVGDHNVSVEIRDQIARTTIEESFVNRTNARLEGIFHFPLPQDASISGFGMWINGELIEADVVEKQRAREIYETILRERRDPGLLEWTGGNIFKARVFPIEPHSEKRIKIVYTQVLPLRANQYRYSYGLRSEMLQKTPLRELSLSVLVHSALPLKSVHSPTHSVRAQQTEHSAKLEFAAQEYTPQRDFEVVCEVSSDQADVVVVPHRRGDDGYFMVQLTPPTGEGHWQREMIPDGQPLEVLLVCDTSASMDPEKRRQQEEFVGSTLAALGSDDRFNIAVCDVDSHLWKDEPVAASEESVAEARSWLADRISLGWTDLDRMVESLLPRLTAATHVVYVGDGIVTARDANPQAFANRLRQLTVKKRIGTFHAVSVGNSYESTVLKAIAQFGGGSVRQIGGEQTPQQTAFELLSEIAQPALRDLKVEFRGLQVAAVYPDTLSNLAAGTQQILLGRYLPQSDDQSGEIVITGYREGEPVRFSSRITLTDAESGNSFIPRLWARAHLDQLLAQGSSQAVRDEIIAMSEEFHIITPNTSLLVLETDEDRERFKVKRRYEMRDGERFFAEGRDDASYELLQKQMKRAGDWRLALRRQVLSQLSQLGRHPELFQQLNRYGYDRRRSRLGSLPMSGPIGRIGGSHLFASSGMRGRGLDAAEGMLGLNFASNEPMSYGMGGMGGGMGGMGRETGEMNVSGFWADAGELLATDAEQEYSEASDEFLGDGLNQRSERDDAEFGKDSLSMLRTPAGFLDKSRRSGQSFMGGFGAAEKPQQSWFFDGYGGGGYGGGGYGGSYTGRSPSGYIGWIHTLFPDLPAPTAIAEYAEYAESTWPEDAVAISQSLDPPLTLNGDGIEVVSRTEGSDPVWERTASISAQHQLYAADRWLHFADSAASPTTVHWCTGEQRGAYSRAFQLGQTREAMDGDLSSFTPGQRSYATSPLHVGYRGYDVEVERPAEDRVVLLLKVKQNRMAAQPDPLPNVRITIDTERHVVLEVVQSDGEKVTSTTKYGEHFQVAGVWWPAKIERFDGEDRRTSVTTQEVKQIDADTFAQRFQEELPGDEAVLVDVPLASVREAEKAVTAGADALEHRLVLLLRSASIQQWDDVFADLEAIEKLQPNKPGLRWLRAAVLIAARRNEEARQLLQQQADTVVEDGGSDELYLANHLLNQAAQIIDYNEMMRLLDRLRPVFERQPEHTDASRTWKRRRVQALRGLGRADEVLALSRELAESAPWDVSAQTTYARELKRSGDDAAASAWLRTQIDLQEERREHEVQQLRDAYANFLREAGRMEDLVAFLDEWITDDPNQAQPLDQYLSALVMADRGEDADATVRRWLEEGRVETKLPDYRLARLKAAMSYALGQRYQLHMGYIDPQWQEPLRNMALFFLTHDDHFDIAARIINDHRFRDSDEADRLFAEIAQRLQENVETLSTDRVQSFVSWTAGREDLTQEEWKRIADALRARWDAEQNDTERQILDGALLRIYRTHFRDLLQLPLMRERIERAETDDEPVLAAALRMELFDELLSRKWTADYEAESLALIDHLSAADQLTQRLLVQIGALHRFVARMLEARYQADMEVLQDQGHPEELTRTELAAKQAEFRKTAGEGVAQRLEKELDREGDDSNPAEKAAAREELLHWMSLERMYLDLKLDCNHAQVADQLWEMIGDQPPVVENEEPEDDGDATDLAGGRMIELLRMERAFAMMNYLAASRSAPEELVKRLEQYIAAGLDREGDAATPWKQARYALLIALDRPDDLERELREWIRTDAFPSPWQWALARLMAERGKIEEAIALFEVVEKASQLSPADYTALADWYLIADRREQYERAKIEAFKVAPERQIRRWIQEQRQPWIRSDLPLPSELDEEILFAFRALFEKSNEPERYVSELREFYTACRDFRLLQMLPDAVTGRTPQQIYPLLERFAVDLMEEIRNEATADEILQRLEVVREQNASAVDRRALDLLEALVERQSSEVLNQPGPHIEAAVAALRRAFDREWAEGEVRQIAKFLDALGTIKQKGLSEERLTQLRALHAMMEPGTDDRLFVGWHLAHALFYSHADQDGALVVMEVALREFDESHPDGWPAHANEPLDGYAAMLESLKRFAVAEKMLTKFLESPLNESQEYWLLQRRDETWTDALREDGQVSLGSGETLYANFEATLVKRLATIGNEGHRQRTIYQLLGIYRIARDKQFEAFQDDLRKFAFERLPPLLENLTNSYPDVVGRTADAVKELLDAREALRFAIERYENYPLRFQYTGNNAWQQLSSRMSRWRLELNEEIGDLEPRLLKIVLDELRRDLQTRQSRSRSFYNRSATDFWVAKEAEFVRVAEEVLQKQKESARAVVYIAQYFYQGLHRHQRAIEILFIAHIQGLLDDAQQIVLVDFLHSQNRHAESILILGPLIERDPNVIGYRTKLITAYYKAKRPEQMRKLLADTDAHFRQQGRWEETVLSQMASTSLDIEMFAEAVAYYEELISRRQRTSPNRGIGDGTLSYSYRQLARAYSALGETRKAVDAAAASVVSWGPNHMQRQSAINSLWQVLVEAPDLDAYVEFRDQQAEETGQDSPLIRQQIGTIYAQRREHQKAIEQLRIAIELQPHDLETRQKLIASYKVVGNQQAVIDSDPFDFDSDPFDSGTATDSDKAVGDQQAVVEQMLALLEIDRHNLALYKDLAQQLQGDQDLSERAATTLVEAAPNEAEHHQALAEFRQEEGRWDEAIKHWKHVAELRRLEPTGLLKLAEAQIHQERFDEAQRTIDKLNRTEWPARFGDVRRQVRPLQQKIPMPK